MKCESCSESLTMYSTAFKVTEGLGSDDGSLLKLKGSVTALGRCRNGDMIRGTCERMGCAKKKNY